MINLLRAEFYKMRISATFKFFVVCNLISAVCSVIIIRRISIVIGDVPQELLSQTIFDGTYNFGVIQFRDIDELLNITSKFVILSAFKNYFPMLSVAFFVTFYMMKEFEYGGIRNFLLKGLDRERIFISKYITLLIAVALTLFMYFLGYCIGAIFVFGVSDIDGISILQLVLLYVAQIFLYSSFASICLMTTILIQRSAVIFLNASMVIMGNLAINIVKILTNGQFDLSVFWVLNYIMKMNPTDLGYSFFVVGAFTLIISIIVANSRFKRIEFE